MHKKFGGKFAVNVRAADTRRNARPGAASSSTSEPENDAGKPTEEMNKELPSQAHEGTKLMKAQEEEAELDDVVPSQPLNIPRPQLRLASDLHTMIADEKSLIIETTEAAQNRRELDGARPPVVDDGTHSTINVIKGKESKRWKTEETQHFFLALRMCGIDFTLMATMFPGRKRFELKRKYVKESSSNPNLLQEILDTKEPLNEDILRAGPQRIEVASMDTQMDKVKMGPGSDKKKLPRCTLRKKYSQKKNASTPLKRKAGSEQMDDTVEPTTVPAEKRLEIAQNPSSYQPVPRKVDPNVIPIITNIVATFELGTSVDLQKVKSLFTAEFDTAFPTRVTLHLANPKTSANVFHSGKVNCSGATTIESAILATRSVAKLIKASGLTKVKYLNFRVETISATLPPSFRINLEELFENNRSYCRFEPKIFPAVIWKMKVPKVTLAIFTSGSINLSGGKTMKQVCIAYEEIFKIVQIYKK